MLVQKFEESVEKFPHNTALHTGQRELSYDELNRAANRLAWRIQKIAASGSWPGHQVGLLFEHGADMIVGMLGALKSGMIYIPLDVTYPLDRLKYMLSDSGAGLILTNRENEPLARKLVRGTAPAVQFMDIGSIPESEKGENIPRQASAEQPTYILYTSGSTGRPKGVVQNHRNVWYYVRNWIQRFSITPRDRLTLVTAFSHDGAEQDIFAALLSGAALYPFDVKRMLNPTELAALVQNRHITIWHSVPTLFRYFVEALSGQEDFSRLRWILLGGESLRSGDIAAFNRFFPHALLANVYGQTESSVNSICLYRPGDTFGRLLLGDPLDETEILLVDEDDEIVEYIGTGEIVVACRYLAPGYWKDAEKTEQRFSHDPELGRLYWTGDLGGRLGGAKIEILGRLDSQVKLRGFRIELGEIESRLIRHPRIKEAVVLVKEYDAGGKYLTAYIVSLPPPTASTNKTSETSLTNELRQYLSLRLPDYMIPNIFVEIERMPLTPTGKIDRQALPEPRLKEETTGPAPLTDEVERQLAEIWSAVLNVPPAAVGRQANFFELGGHSLKALTVMGRVHRQLNVRLDIEDIFSFPLLYSLARKIRNSRQAAFSPIRATEKREYYPLSSAQKRLYFIQQLEPGATGYNMTHMRIFEGSMDRPALARILKTLICRHQSLRTSFHLMEGEPVQRIHDDVDFEIEYYDAGLVDNFVRPFDLSRSPLLRVGLCQLEEQRYTIMADIHHIAADGSSLQIFNRELQRLYRGESLPPLRLQYRDFSQWQNRQRESETYRAQATYWQGIFAGEIPVLQLACDHPRPPVQGHRGRRIRFGLDRQQTEALKDLALSQEVTLFVLLSGCLRVLLFKLSGQQDVVIGTPVVGRRHSDLDGIMGMFVNTLALRHFLQPPQPFSQFLTALKEETLTAFGNQDYQFEDLVGSVEVSRDMGRNPLFDVMLVLHNQAELADFEPEFEAPDISSRLDSGPIGTNFDLILHGVEAGGRLSFSLEYCTDLFKEETIRRWIGYFERIIAAVLRDPERVPGDIEIMDTAEKEALLALCSGPVEKSLPAPTISAWFDRQAAAHPGQIALIGTAGCHRWSYGELRRQIGRLAGVLRAKGIGAGQVVGVMIGRSKRMVAAILAVLQVRAAFLPIDTGYPESRKAVMLRDSQVGLLVGDHLSGESTPWVAAHLERLDLLDPDLYRGAPRCRARVGQPQDPLYVIYTSGSTGVPKGVMLEHRSLINLLHHQYRHTGIDFSKVLQFATISFDVAYQEIFSTLVGGGQLVLVSEETRQNLTDLFRVVTVQGVKTLFLPAVLVKFIGRQLHYLQQIPAVLDHIVAAGEQLVVSEELARFLVARHICLHNHYGPAEAHVVTAHRLEPHRLEEGSPPIGKPVMNTAVYITGPNRQLQPLGVRGELFIAGRQVGRGYLNNPELTAEKFVNLAAKAREDTRSSTPQTLSPNPYILNPKSQILYRTGDLARFLPDGTIEFLGRIDHQVKIRGYRVEPTEVEAVLLKLEAVKEAAVIDGGGEPPCLIAYVVGQRPDQGGDIPQLRRQLSQLLPDYMVPAYIVELEQIPLQVNGKVDRQRLPRPTVPVKGADEGPATPLEHILADIWAEVLPLKRASLGVHRDFFELGGHSLKVMLLGSKIQQRLGIQIPLSEIFKNPTLRGMAGYIEPVGQGRWLQIPCTEKREYYPLSSAQKRLYILQQVEKENTVYNMPFAALLEGEMDDSALARLFGQLIGRHESFRTSFHILREAPVQRVQRQVEFEIEYFDLAAKGREVIIKDFIRPFDLSKPPLLRVGLIKEKEGRYVLMVDMHHIVGDGFSLELLIGDFVSLYRREALPPLRLRYRDYAAWQHSPGRRAEMKPQQEYWLRRFAGHISLLKLPYDFPRPAVQSFKGSRITAALSPKERQALQDLAQRSGATLFMIMLALYSVLLARLSGQEEVVVGVPGAGRTRADWQPLIGIFINTMALPTFPHGEQTFSAFLDAVRQTSLEAFDNQDYPFEDLVEQLGLRRDAGRNPLFDVMFNFRKPGLPEKRLPGLRLRPVEYRGGISKFDLTLDAGESTDTVALTWEYSTDLFRRRTVERWTAYYRRLLTAVTKAPEQRLSALEILLPQERKQILEVWNNTAAAYPQEQTIADLLAVPVRRQMYRVALVGAKGHWLLTYGEFDRRAGHLALLLRRRGAGAERPVGIAAVVSPDLVVGLSAVVRSGAPFVPIDPAFPPDRIRCILADSGASIVLTDQADRLPPSFGGHSLSIITGMQAAGDMTRDGEAKGDGGSSLSALAYIIYTSGSTGSPKGVMVEHRSLTNQIFGLMQMFPFDHTLHHILLAPITFDPSVQQIFLPLTSGGKLFLVPTELRQDASSLYDFIVSRQMDLVNTVPSLMEAIVRCAGGQPRRRLKYVILAGESFGRDLYLRLNERFTVDILINIYGPAEATINTTLYRCAPGERGLSIPIGKPLPNYWVWITDACTNLLPPGLVGEMSISGQGLARGYLNQPELTAEKFVTVPAAGCQPPAAKLYRTGDLGRFLPDGNLEFCGRIDHQVKIRGMRVEPAEIEERLRAHPAVQEAVVTVVRLRAEDKYLCAYYVPEASRLPELWPSIGEYFVWDDLLYHAMSRDERRNRSFRQAIERAVKDRVVLDVGTGRDAILARFCAQAGAGKVYAVEVLEEFAGRAAQTVKASGLTGQISVIHGDIRDVTLPEKVDVCVSQLIGALGSAEGTIPLVNSAFRFLKPGGRMIPRRCVTRIAAAALPEALLQSPGFTEVSVQYVEKIFAKIGRPFDLRLCVKHFPPSHILSDSGIFEDLDFSFKMESGGATDVHLTIRRRGTVHGLLLWLNLYTGEDEMIDTLHNAHSWLPLFVPLFYPGLEMTEGDYIAARCLRTCGPNGLTPDYRISGSLNRKGQDPLKFDYSLPYDQQAYRRTPFYRQILTDGCGRVGTRDDGRGQPGAAELKTFLKRRLPDYMIPGHFVPLERLPLTRHGKIDLEALPQPAALASDSALAPPGDPVEQRVAEIWAAVLGHEVGLVGLDSDFFALGGHSLKATLMINRLHRQFNVKVPLAEIFKSPTVRGVAAYIREAKEETYSAIEPAEKSDYYPLSSAQKRLYVLQRLDTGSLVYHIPLVMRLAGAVKAPRFREIFARLIQRHQSLRTSFELVGGEPVQRVQREVDFEIEYYNIAAKDAKRREIKNFIRSFDLSKPPLLRVGLIREKEERYVLMVDVHHIVADGLSMNILVREFAGLYRQETLPPLRLQYRDYALWQQRQVKQRRLCSQEQFWREEFGGEIPVLHLPLDFPRPPVQSFAGDSLTFEIDAAGIRDLRELCRLQEVSLFMMVLAVFNVLLFKLSDQEDLVVGTPVAARRHEDLQPLIGMFVNTLALRHQPRPEMTFRGFVRQIRRHTLRAFENQEYPFEELVGGLQLERDAGRNPLFDVMVALQNTDPPLEALPGLEWRPYDGGSGLRVARFDLTLVAVEAADRLRFTLEFCRRLFRRQTMVRLADYFKRIVSAVSAEPGQLLKGIEIIPPAEKVRILNEFSGSSPLPAPQGSLLTWLSHRADEGADCIALGGRALAVSDFAVVSYRELFGRAEQLARRLRAGGCRENSLVAIKVSPCLDMVTGILGILKGGGAFMPIDPAAPPERVRDMLEDSGAEIVLGDRSLADCRGERPLPNHRSTLCPAPHTSLAYVIYTSGSSGRPKGIPVEHRSLLNLCRWHNGHFGIDCTDRAAKYAGFGFDASIWEIFPYLLAGSAIYVVPEEIKLDMRRLNRFFETYHITVAFLPTQVCEVFLHIDNRSLRLLLTGGDALKRFVRRRYRLANNYGPTENTVVSTSFWVERPYDNIPIGRPVWNHRVYIMNRYGSAQPLGVPGELWVASEGLARGYLNNPELTAEKFVENSNIPLFQHSIIPVSKRSGDKFYRTGDLCRFLPDGNIEFLGRIDFQVKLRGLRIELGEIEAALLRHPEIKEAVVTVRGDGDDDKYLAAYIAPLPPSPPSKTNKTDPLKWREYLSQTLPDYMIPAYFVHLEALPLNTSGKIDRRALPAPDTAVVNPPHLASRNQVEAQLPDICRQVLAADTVGLNDDFFRLGGNSLKVIKLIAEIHRVFGVEMPVFQVFRTPRIREIARFIVQGKYRLDREELYMVFNPPGDNLLFCFPPAVGYGLAYQELAARLPEYALYAFNYIGSQDLMERYVEAVIQAQPRGPVRLFGYSAGGKLCVRAARLLEQRGLEVADIILLDCARKRRELTPEEYETLSREFIHELETGLDGLGLGFMKEKVVDRLKRYDRYWDCLDDLQPVQADIHLIRAEEKGDDEAGQDWRDLTEGEYRVLRGSGPHRDMMKPPFLDQNAAVIRQLLSPQVVITPRIRSAHRRLSDYSLEFLKYVRRRPEALALSCYESLKSGDVNDELQPWPTFVGPALLRAIRQAAEGVSALIKTIPQKIFQNDARRMSDCYGSPLNLVQTQMQGLDDQYLAGLLGRGDFVLTAGGLKCLEFNMSANLGGLALPFWESLYLQTPVISRFITEQHIDIYNLNLLGLLFRHLIAAAAARGNPPGGELNIAVVLPKDETGSTGLPQQEAYLNAIYQETLLAVDRSLTGRVILTDYPHLRVADKGLRWRSQAIHVLVEMYHGVVPPEIFRLFQSGRLVLFNGPITGLLSNKLNLALLSEHRDSAAFNRQERAIIGNYIPWTRQIKATITTYRGEQVSLADLILDHRPELVIKPAVGFGGQDVFIGKFTSPRDWASLVDRALQQKKWLAQEYCDSLPLLYQTGGDGCRVHRGAWGFYVFGEKYAGGNVRLLPVHVEPGIVNVKQGAKASVIFEVAK